MLLVIINGLVFATHSDEQSVDDLYPGSTIMAVPNDTPIEVAEVNEDGTVKPAGPPPALTPPMLAYAVKYEATRRITAQGLTRDVRQAISEHVAAIEATAGNNPQGQDAADITAALAIYSWIKSVNITAAALTVADFPGTSWPAWDPSNAGWSALIGRVSP